MLVALTLDYQTPLAAASLLGFLGQRAVPAMESWDGTCYRRTLRLAGGDAALAVHLAPEGADPGSVRVELCLADAADADQAVRLVRRLLDLDADPAAVDGALGGDALLGPLVARRPGLRVPGAVDPHELLVRAVVGQQVSVAGARTIAGRLVAALGEPLSDAVRADLGPSVELARHFPTAAAMASLDPAALPMPRARGRSLVQACRAVAEGQLDLGAERDPDAVRADLLGLAGIGPWTADYLLLRCSGRRDVFLPSDLGVRRALERLGQDGTPAAAARLAERWRPWRAYAVLHLWTSLGED